MLTLVIVADDETEAVEAIEAAKDASCEHPCRIIALVGGDAEWRQPADAQIRVGGDAGAGEVIVLRLYGALAGHGEQRSRPAAAGGLPRCGVVAQGCSPGRRASAIGKMAQRRITDAAEARDPRRRSSVVRTPTSRAIPTWHGPASPCGVACWPRRWTSRHTSLWWQQSSPGKRLASTDLLAGWLAHALKCPVTRDPAAAPAPA